jgi:tetratricopeptide (TPR) repeat protein
MLNKFLVAGIFLVSSLTCFSDPADDIYAAYVSGNMKQWKEIIDRLGRQELKGKELGNLLNFQYGYIGWCIGEKRFDEAKGYLETAEKNLLILEKDGLSATLVKAYKAAFYGFRISMNKILAPVLGKKSMDLVDEAVKLDEKNAFAWVQKGNMEFFRPAVFGGSKEEALKYFKYALALMENSDRFSKKDWNYLALLVVIAQSYYYTEDYLLSKNTLDKIMNTEPGFTWIRNEMVPKIEAKLRK